MRVIPKKTSRVTEAIKSHIAENFKAYIIVSLIILIGIVLGVMLVNNISEDQTQNIQTYLHSFTEALKELDYMEKHPEEYKVYHNVDKMFEDILNDD